MTFLVRFLPHIIGAVALIAFGWWVWNLADTVEDQRDTIAALHTDLAAETLARKQDVDGLTKLAAGLAAAGAKRATDERILGETIDATNPAAASPALARLLSCLLAADAGGDCNAAAAVGGAPAR